MMALKIFPFDPARYLETEDDILHYLEAAMEGNDPKHIASALGDVARSKGMNEIAGKSGLGGQDFDSALAGNGNPTRETLVALLGAIATARIFDDTDYAALPVMAEANGRSIWEELRAQIGEAARKRRLEDLVAEMCETRQRDPIRLPKGMTALDLIRDERDSW
jgi:probable addiction module antidote protein